MPNHGIKVTIKGHDATTTDTKIQSWTSSLYQHSISQTEFDDIAGGAETRSHFQPYIPIMISYVGTGVGAERQQDVTSGSAQTRIQLAGFGKYRYYLFYQGV